MNRLYFDYFRARLLELKMYWANRRLYQISVFMCRCSGANQGLLKSILTYVQIAGRIFIPLDLE